MDKPKPKRTPAAAHLKMTKDTTRDKVDLSLYRSIIGSLLYLTVNRPDIAFTVGVCARYQADPRTSHLYSAKRILKYITSTLNYGLRYTFDTTAVLIGYCDANWAGCSDDRKSTSVEYIAAGSSCSQLLLMKQMLEEYGITQSSMVLYCNNMSAISISKIPVQHRRIKHIDIHHHFIRELVKDEPSLLHNYIYDNLQTMVATHFKSYQSSDSSFVSYSSRTRVSDSMASSPSKNTPPFKDATTNENLHIPLNIPARSAHAAPTVQGSRSPSRAVSPPRDIPSRSTNRGKFSITPPSPPSLHESFQTDDDETSDDINEDYVPISEKTPTPKETTVSVDDPTSSPDNRTSEPLSTEVLGESSKPLLPQGHVGFSFGPQRLPVKRQRVVSTKAGRRKIPPNVPSVPIDGMSFHSEEGAHKWITLPENYVVSYPTLEHLAKELTGVNVGEFVFNHLLRHVDTFAINIPICFLRLLSRFLLSQQSAMLTPIDAVGTAPWVISLSIRLFQGSHILNVYAKFDNAPGGSRATTATNPTVGQPLVLYVPLANRLLQALMVESRSLTRQISELSNRRTMLEGFLHDFRRAASRTPTSPIDPQG
ncbi:putative mitochondrial protein [Cucumis melo var. makuwa]|uniref:Putative mitochondrial protein n=1 Tax=Cucumis melo var. makuwa TaxID=1194695 RepID=A0A5D3C3N3_CUCMM|nr:putative mitochondrial protein [Cucumis melo var. makuwa]